MTQPNELLPEGAANYDSLHDFAAKTEEDWHGELEANEVNRWGDNGVLGGLFQGLAQGKPFIAALIEAVVHEAFEDITGAYEATEDAFASLGANFNGKWYDLISAADAAAYANAQLAVQNRAIVDLFDNALSDLSSYPSWDVKALGVGGGKVIQDGNGNAAWSYFLGDRGERYRWNAAQTATSDQVISTVASTRVQEALLGGQSHCRLLGRVVDTGDIGTFAYAEWTDNGASVGYSIAGTKTELKSQSTATSNGDRWDFYLTGDDWQLRRNNTPLITVGASDGTTGATSGAGYQSVGFEMFAAARALINQTSPGKLAMFSADDH